MTGLCVLALLASGVLIRRVELSLFRRRGFDAHVREALAVAEPSDDWELWAQELRGAA